eukprot:7935801-Pyramimonas_sp.AAC.1
MLASGCRLTRAVARCEVRAGRCGLQRWDQRVRQGWAMTTRSVAAQWVSDDSWGATLSATSLESVCQECGEWQHAPALLPVCGKLCRSPLSSVAALGSGARRVGTGSRPRRCPAKYGRRHSNPT